VTAPAWRKSRYSVGGGACAEVAPGVLVRDSTDPHGTVLTVTAAAWREFTARVKGQDQ